MIDHSTVQLGTQMVWTALTVLGAIVSSLWVLIFMLRHHVSFVMMYHLSVHSHELTTDDAGGSCTFQIYQKRILTPVVISGGLHGPFVDSQVLHANSYKTIIARICEFYPQIDGEL